MTQEEKAKAYDEALERAKEFVCKDNVEVAEYIFPELKESEGEKIRKWLIDTIKQVPNDSIEWETIDKSSILAWLENLGEQKTFDYECANIQQKDSAPNDEEMKELLRTEYEKGKYDAIVEEKLWKPADGDDLPEYEREVVVLYQPGTLKLGKTEYCVSFAHRPDPEGWDGKSMLTGKIEHYTPKTYGIGGWNIPDVMWWLDLDLPIIEEE